MATNRTLGERLRELRAARGLAQEQVASAIGVRTLSYGRWERDQQLPGLQNRIALARYFDVDLHEITADVDAEHVEIALDALSQESTNGYGARIGALEQRVAGIEATLARCETLLERIAKSLRLGA